jgi:peptidoglycan-associated lipoprotein
MTGKTRLVSLLAVAAAAAVACSHPAPAPAPTPAQGPNQDSINAANARRDSIARAEAARRDSIARAQADAAGQSARDAATKALTQVIYFDFDSDALKDDARSSLDAKIAILNASTGVKIKIGGNTDERGSDEYNLALGQRRAASAKRYLTDHGISGDRIDIISYGEEHPVGTGHDESSWSQNRRDDFEITAGADQVKAAP